MIDLYLSRLSCRCLFALAAMLIFALQSASGQNASDPDGLTNRLFIVGQGDYGQWNGTSWTRFIIPGFKNIHSFAFTSDGGLWCLGDGSDLGETTREKGAFKLTRNHGAPNGWSVSSLAVDKDDVLWGVGKGKEVLKKIDGRWMEDETSKPVKGYVQDIAFDRQGALWVAATTGKVFKWNGKAKSFDDRAKMFKSGIFRIAFDTGQNEPKEGVLWCVGRSGNLWRWTNDKWLDKERFGNWRAHDIAFYAPTPLQFVQSRGGFKDYPTNDIQTIEVHTENGTTVKVAISNTITATLSRTNERSQTESHSYTASVSVTGETKFKLGKASSTVSFSTTHADELTTKISNSSEVGKARTIGMERTVPIRLEQGKQVAIVLYETVKVRKETPGSVRLGDRIYEFNEQITYGRPIVKKYRIGSDELSAALHMYDKKYPGLVSKKYLKAYASGAPDPSARIWWVFDDGVRHGPMTKVSLDRWVATLTSTPTFKVWREGWKRGVTKPATEVYPAIWWVWDGDGKRYGPIPKVKLDRWVAKRRVTARSPVWREGWKRGVTKPATKVYPDLLRKSDK